MQLLRVLDHKAEDVLLLSCSILLKNIYPDGWAVKHTAYAQVSEYNPAGLLEAACLVGEIGDVIGYRTEEYGVQRETVDYMQDGVYRVTWLSRPQIGGKTNVNNGPDTTA